MSEKNSDRHLAEASGGSLNTSVMFSLYFAMAVTGAGQTVVFAIIPMLGRKLGLHELVFTMPYTSWRLEPREMAITALSALSALAFSLSAPLWGGLSDRVGRKPVILVGLFGYAIGTLVFNGVAWLGLQGVMAGVLLYLLLAASRVFHSAVMSATHPAVSAFVVDVTSLSERTKGMVKLQAFNQLGVMIGPALAWFVSISFLAPLMIQAGLMALSALIVWRYLPSADAHRVAAPSGNEALQTPPASSMSYLDPRYRVFLFLAFAVFSMVGMVQQTLGFYFQDRLGLNGVQAAQYFSAAMVVSSAAMLAAQYIVVRYFTGLPMKLVLWGLPFCLVSFVLLANAHTLQSLLVAIALFGFGMGQTTPGFNASATLVVEPHEQGELAGMMGAMIGLGFVSGPLLGGYLYKLSPSYPYWFAAVASVFVIVMVIRVERRLRGQRKLSV